MEIKSLEKDENGQARFPGCSNIREYEFLDKLGEGTFGEVYKARSKKDTKIVALKKILMHHEKEGFPITAIREIKLMKALSHPNILQLKEMSIERGKGEGRKKPSMYMVFPYMEHDLSGLLENPAVQFTEPQIKCYLMQLLEGLKFMHANRILHRDMKAANLLISNGGILQIADFGLARPYDDAPPLPGKGGGDSKREYTALVVTRWYRPPELLLQLRKYTTAIDLWGVGCVFGEMFKGKPILAGKSDLNQAELIFNLVGTPTEENMPGWSQLPGCEGVKNFAFKRGNLHTFFKDTLISPPTPFQHDPAKSPNSQIPTNSTARSSAVSGSQCPQSPHPPPTQAMVVGQPLVLADQIPDTAASPASLVEADQMHQAPKEVMDTTQFTETRNAAGLSHLHKEIPDYRRVLPYRPTRHGMDRNPTELTGEMIVGINSDKVARHRDQGTSTLTFQITAAMTAVVSAAMTARETLVSMAHIQMQIGAQQVDVITAGILHQEEGAGVPVSETAVEVRVMVSSDVFP
ncbi:Serine/threonine-protein kinase bur1 [Penicillium digitatum PHI26]|uniref:Serine/threonine-protein kinase bur1 n=2 Tax=Penicillium digitatum TaxID=36651 RepID=K9FAU5_PEND2|nr:Serine/threonine-protein kinase bur1 [Penicillium digitatum Pd1]EKV05187.1 Serine/threonine-protein kinase bur1 [Penicillium digitatum PHI26]EKV19733.1 Serine/threonine-protein kinase bur1 [Penicillium digitatum Pd1]